MRPFIKYLLIPLLSLFITSSLKAQTFFESARGYTSINLPVGGIARVNTTASSLKIGYYYNRSDKNRVFGIDASGISNNGMAPLVTNKELSPEANVNVNLGFKNITSGEDQLTGYDYLNLRVGIGAAQYRLIDINNTFEQQVSVKSFTKFNAGISYNYYLNGNMIFGGYAGYERTNNISSLSQLTVKETMTTGMDSDGTERTAETEYTAWEGEFKALDQFSLFWDYVYIPDYLSNRMALSIYSRSSFNSINSMTNGGLGLYLNKEGEPLQIVGGLIYEFEDLFDDLNAGTSLGERGVLGIVLGYNF